MLSIQEIVDKTKEQRKRIKYAVEGFGYYHPDINVRNEGKASIIDGLTYAEARAVTDSIRAIPLKEFLAKSGSAGIQGAAYLVPAKAHDLLVNYSEETDKVPTISALMLADWKGDEWTLSVADDATYRPQAFSSGGKLPEMEVDATQVTMNFTMDRKLGINISVGSNLLEDVTDYDLVEWHIREAAKAFGREATDRALTVLLTGTDGVGTLNSSATGDADETMLTGGTTSDIVMATRKLNDDRFIADTLICTGEAWGHSISMHATPTGWDQMPPAEGFHTKIGILDVLLSTCPSLHASTDLADAAFTDCISLIYSRGNALATGRKRWLRLEQYADPVSDLVGAVVVGEQDSVTLYNDSIYKLTET